MFDESFYIILTLPIYYNVFREYHYPQVPYTSLPAITTDDYNNIVINV